jgi:hypothetical protein
MVAVLARAPSLCSFVHQYPLKRQQKGSGTGIKRKLNTGGWTPYCCHKGGGPADTCQQSTLPILIVSHIMRDGTKGTSN